MHSLSFHMLLSGYVIPVSASGGAAAVKGGAPGYHHAPYCGEKAQRLLNMPLMKDLISPNNPYFLRGFDPPIHLLHLPVNFGDLARACKHLLVDALRQLCLINLIPDIVL